MGGSAQTDAEGAEDKEAPFIVAVAIESAARLTRLPGRAAAGTDPQRQIVSPSSDVWYAHSDVPSVSVSCSPSCRFLDGFAPSDPCASSDARDVRRRSARSAGGSLGPEKRKVKVKFIRPLQVVVEVL